MSKIEYFSLEGLRIDGRRKDEVRNIKVFCGSDCSLDSLDYDGVAEIIHGLNKVQVLVRGPSEDGKNTRNSYGISEEKVEINCEVVISTEKKVKNSPNERLIKDLILSVKSIYEEMIIHHTYKGSSLYIFVNIVEYDGSIKSTVINAVGLALVDAGVAIKDIVGSSTVVYLDSVVLTDPNQLESNAATGFLCIAAPSSSDKIIYMDYKSKVPLEEFKEMFDSALSSSKMFTEYAKERLHSYARRAVLLNQKLHSS